VFLFGVELQTNVMSAACFYGTEYFAFAAVQVLDDDEPCGVCLFGPRQIPFARRQRNTSDFLRPWLPRPELLVFVLGVVNHDVVTAWVYYLVRVRVLVYVVLKVTAVTKDVFHLDYLLQSLHFILIVILIQCLNYYNIISFTIL
jgi:hypothetical protein